MVLPITSDTSKQLLLSDTCSHTHTGLCVACVYVVRVVSNILEVYWANLIGVGSGLERGSGQGLAGVGEHIISRVGPHNIRGRHFSLSLSLLSVCVSLLSLTHQHKLHSHRSVFYQPLVIVSVCRNKKTG